MVPLGAPRTPPPEPAVHGDTLLLGASLLFRSAMGCESVANQCCDDWCRTTPAAEQATHGHIAERLCAGTVALEAMEVMAKQREHARRVVDLAMAGTRRGRKTQEQVVVEIG